jgi:hypothetical protein
MCNKSNRLVIQFHNHDHVNSFLRQFVGENHIRNSGYLELAETNGIIMVFPQALGSSPQNEIGCWDTYNVTQSLFGERSSLFLWI